MSKYGIAAQLLNLILATFVANQIVGTNALAHDISFDTDYQTGLGDGEILSQGNPELARIFTYREDDVYATAIPFTVPQAAPSHFHLFDEATLGVTVDIIGLLMGDDASGVTFTFGGESPTNGGMPNSAGPCNLETAEPSEGHPPAG